MCHPLNISVAGGKWFLQYGDSGRSFPKDSTFASNVKQKVSGRQELEEVFVATVQVSTFC